MAVKKLPRKPRKIFKKKPCRMCKEDIKDVDFKDYEFLRRYISDRGKIVPPRITGTCTKHQRLIVNRIKRARIAGLLPYVRAKSTRDFRELREFSRELKEEREDRE